MISGCFFQFCMVKKKIYRKLPNSLMIFTYLPIWITTKQLWLWSTRLGNLTQVATEILFRHFPRHDCHMTQRSFGWICFWLQRWLITHWIHIHKWWGFLGSSLATFEYNKFKRITNSTSKQLGLRKIQPGPGILGVEDGSTDKHLAKCWIWVVS